MAYPGNSGYYPAEQSGDWSNAGGYAQWSPEPDSGTAASHRYWTQAVVLLGLCTYLVSFGPMLAVGGIDWDVRFAVLAALLAAFGLLPRQTPATKIVAALAALGFLDAVSRVIVVPEGLQPGWAMWVVVVLNGLQTGAAAGALLTQPSESDEQQAWYAAYAEQYAQAAAQYYGQYAQEEQPEAAYESGTAHAQQVQPVSAPAPRPVAAPQQASYTEFLADGAVAEPPAAAPSAQPAAGLPSVGHTEVPVQQPAAQQAAAEPEYRTAN